MPAIDIDPRLINPQTGRPWGDPFTDLDAQRFWFVLERQRGPWAAEQYWHATAEPHRQYLLEGLKRLPPFRSVLELGCHALPNLRLIRAHYPGVKLGGIDLVRSFVQAGLDRAVAEGWEPDLWAGDYRDWLPDFAPGSWDVIVSCYCLTYCAPERLPEALAQIRRVARVGMVFLEPTTLYGLAPGLCESGTPSWHHDYVTPLVATGPFAALRACPVEPPVQCLDTCLVAEVARG